jgi:hypothetical protein
MGFPKGASIPFGCERGSYPDREMPGCLKDIEIIPLARKKMEKRGITEAWVSEALRNADQIVEVHGGRLVAHQRRRIRRREMLLRVVFEEPRTSMW